MGSNTATITQLLGQLYEATSGAEWTVLPGELDRLWEGGRDDVVQLSRAIQTESSMRRFGTKQTSSPSVFEIEPFATDGVRSLGSSLKNGAPRLRQTRKTPGAGFDQRTLLAQSVDQAQLAVVVLNTDGEVVEMTRSARTLLSQEDGLVVRANGLRAAVGTEQLTLCALLDEAMRVGDRTAQEESGEGAMLITRRAPRRPLQVVVTPVRAGELSIEMQGAVMVFLCDPEAVPLSRAPVMRRLYGLTPTEGRLADELAAGTELQTAAQHMRLTVHTARFHLKSIFRKTGVNRQNELVRLVLGLPGKAD